MRNIGRLDKRIEIQTRSSTTRDAFGAVNFEQDWGDISVCFADVKETRGDERDVNGKQEVKLLAEFTMRDRSITAASQRIIYDGKVFDITSVKPLSSNRRDGIVVSGEYVEDAPITFVEGFFLTPTGDYYMNADGDSYRRHRYA